MISSLHFFVRMLIISKISKESQSDVIALSVRNLLCDLREQGIITGGPKPFAKKNRQRFLQALDEMIVKIRRRKGIYS
ncbi:MAG: DUF188 domain-containing protein [Candidatus Sabulitectum sp.]|nr:DUF188 domain-containing protein [Candidatus Sabulitectum sp.]